jgi:putative membrane protein
LGFLILEMFLWRKPLGLKVFGMSPAMAESTAVLAANQGLYNGFLAAGLVLSFFLKPEPEFALRVFVLSCVVVAGAYGAWSVSRRILVVQALPAALALVGTVLSH